MRYQVVPLLLSTAAFATATPVDERPTERAETADDAGAAGGSSSAGTYDYIVVGSGPGGGPLACDLARAGYSTLLLEAGDDQGDNPIYADLFNFNQAGNDEKSRWDFWVKHFDTVAEDQKYEHFTYRQSNGSFYSGLNPPAGSKALGIQYPRTGTLGGCAMHNGGVCTLPQDEDWNTIVKRTGDTSWEADKMRKYFEKIEKNEYLPAGTPNHGFDGWLSTATGDNSWANDASLPATRILKELARLTGQDPNTAAQDLNKDILGKYKNRDTITSFYSMVQHMTNKGKRSSPNTYIRATLQDPKKYPLTVKLNSLVTKVVFTKGKNPEATGVEVLEGQSLYRADPRYKSTNKGKALKYKARREVIVSGGSFNSPQILKLSGIGPKAELAKFKIPLIKDLPGVGERLADNYEGSILSLGQSPVGGGLITLQFRTPNAPDKRRNIFTWCGAFAFEGFWPGFPNDYGANQYTCAMIHLNPKSQQGTVRLTSADPQDVPDVHLHLFKSNGKQDQQEMVEAAGILRKAWQAAGNPVLPFNELHPCPGTGNGNCSDAAQREVFRTQVYSHHAASTCSIGGDDDPLAVLDSRFRVRGVGKLRVVDASAFPVVPGAFPVLPTFMLSAKAAEAIIADAKKSDY